MEVEVVEVVSKGEEVVVHANVRIVVERIIQ